MSNTRRRRAKFWEGVARLLDWRGTLNRRIRMPRVRQSDADMLWHDWQALQQDQGRIGRNLPHKRR